MSYGYIIAGAAIWATGRSEQEAMTAYCQDTGDDTLTLDTISRNPHSGKTFIMPCDKALFMEIARVGGDIAWDDSGDIATLDPEERAARLTLRAAKSAATRAEYRRLYDNMNGPARDITLEFDGKHYVRRAWNALSRHGWGEWEQIA